MQPPRRRQRTRERRLTPRGKFGPRHFQRLGGYFGGGGQIIGDRIILQIGQDLQNPFMGHGISLTDGSKASLHHYPGHISRELQKCGTRGLASLA